MEVIEGLRFLASLPLASTRRTEGGEKTQHFNRFHSRLFIGFKIVSPLNVSLFTVFAGRYKSGTSLDQICILVGPIRSTVKSINLCVNDKSNRRFFLIDEVSLRVLETFAMAG